MPEVQKRDMVVLDDGTVAVSRYTNLVDDSGKVISRGIPHVENVAPGDNLDNVADPEVRGVAATVHTPARIQVHLAKVMARKNEENASADAAGQPRPWLPNGEKNPAAQ